MHRRLETGDEMNSDFRWGIAPELDMINDLLPGFSWRVMDGRLDERKLELGDLSEGIKDILRARVAGLGLNIDEMRLEVLEINTNVLEVRDGRACSWSGSPGKVVRMLTIFGADGFLVFRVDLFSIDIKGYGF